MSNVDIWQILREEGKEYWLELIFQKVYAKNNGTTSGTPEDWDLCRRIMDDIHIACIEVLDPPNGKLSDCLLYQKRKK